jgi:hypothetical protein
MTLDELKNILKFMIEAGINKSRFYLEPLEDMASLELKTFLDLVLDAREYTPKNDKRLHLIERRVRRILEEQTRVLFKGDELLWVPGTRNSKRYPEKVYKAIYYTGQVQRSGRSTILVCESNEYLNVTNYQLHKEGVSF